MNKIRKKNIEPKVSMVYRGIEPINTFPVNSHYMLSIYEGKMSEYDIVIRYRQLENGKWSRIRTPKHIHWAVDILMKQNANKKEAQKFLDLLLSKWETLPAIKNKEAKDFLLKSNILLWDVDKEAETYSKLARKGEYSIKFLFLLAKLLIIQEKTNNDNAYMFKTLLDALKSHKNIYKLIHVSTGKYSK